MRKKSILTLVVLFFMTLVFSVNTFAAVTKNLKKDTDLRPVNWNKGVTLRFKAGQVAVDSVEGGVVAGYIANNYSLGIYGNMKIKVTFKAGTLVRFENAGGVKEGVLASNTPLGIEWSKTNVTFKGGTQVVFGYMGGVTLGTLASGATLPLAKGGSGTFKAGTQVKFNSAGQVTASSALPSGSAGASNQFAGNFKGTFSGAAKGVIQASSDGSGNFAVLLKYDNGLSLQANGTVDSKGNIYCEKAGGICKGKFNGTNSCSGTWAYGTFSGQWQAKRIK